MAYFNKKHPMSRWSRKRQLRAYRREYLKEDRILRSIFGKKTNR